MPYVWVSAWPERREALPLADLWRHVARVRAAAGNKDSAAQARRNAAALSKRRVRGGLEIAAVTPTVHYDRSGPVCGYRSPESALSPDPALTSCGNCKRTRAWRQVS